jgi:hypothetical protein
VARGNVTIGDVLEEAAVELGDASPPDAMGEMQQPHF